VKALIVGIYHAIQAVPLWNDGAGAYLAEKRRLEAYIKGVIAQEQIDLICEEADPAYVTIAQKMAYEFKPRIQWKDISLTSQDSLEAGIWPALHYRPAKFVRDDQGEPYLVEERIPEDDKRETIFVDRILATATSVGAKRILVLCGDAHVEVLKVKLETSGHQVQTNHSLIPEKRRRAM
jgi:hypothetical protein